MLEETFILISKMSIVLHKYSQQEFDFFSFFYILRANLGGFEYTTATNIAPDPTWKSHIKSKNMLSWVIRREVEFMSAIMAVLAFVLYWDMSKIASL